MSELKKPPTSPKRYARKAVNKTLNYGDTLHPARRTKFVLFTMICFLYSLYKLGMIVLFLIKFRNIMLYMIHIVLVLFQVLKK